MTTARDAQELLNQLDDGATATPQLETPKRGRPSGSSGPSRRGKLTVAAIKDKVRTGLELLNATAHALASEKLRPYLLYPNEVDPLTDALAAEINAQPKLYELFMRAAAVGPHAALVTCIVQMGLTRYAIFLQLQAASQQATSQQPETPRNPEPVASPINANGNGPARSLWQE